MVTRKHIVTTRNYRIEVAQYYEQLVTYKFENDKTAFYAIFIRIIPELRKYLKTRLQELIHNSHFPHNFYKEDDFIDDLFISVYEQFNTLKSEEDFYLYLFIEMDFLLKKVERSEHKLHKPLENLEIYAKAERDTLRERITSQLDGDIVFKEELDDISYASQNNKYKIILELPVENTIGASLDKDLTHNLTSEQIDQIIIGLPLEHRNIATLYLFFHLTKPEIRKLTKKSQKEIKQVIEMLKNTLKSGLFDV